MKKAYRVLLTSVNLLLYMVIIAMWIAIPEEVTLNVSVTAFNLVLSAVIIIVYRSYFANFYRSHFFRQLSSTVVSAFLIASILGLLNYLFYVNPAQVDMSSQKWNSLSSESKKILSSLPGELTIHIFGKNKQERQLRSFLELYRLEKNDLNILFHDVQLRPDLVNKFQITKEGVFVLEYKGKKQYVTAINELAMAKAMARIARKKDPVVYYLSGLNNMDFEEAKGNGGLVLKRSLEESAYQVEVRNIQSLGEIPQNVHSLIVWGPSIDLSKDQIHLIDSYLQKGGTLITALDPNLNKDITPEYRKFLQTKGIEIRNNLVIDNHSFVNGSDGIVPLIGSSSSSHEIMEELNFPIFLPLTSSVRATDEKNSKITFTSLISSTVFPHSWAENTPRDYADKSHQFDDGVDYAGPVSLVAAIEDKATNSRIVAFGSSTFVQNNYANFTNNFKFFTSSISWLVDKDNQLVLNLPVFKEKPVFISSPQLGVIFYFSVVFVPLLLVGAAIFSYRRRYKVS